MRKIEVFYHNGVQVLCVMVLVFLVRFSFIGWSEHKLEELRVKIWCLQTDSTIFTRIENKLNKPVYVPKHYLIQFNEESDTIHFEGIYNKQYDREQYYYYSEFSQPVCALEKIDGLEYDSTKTIQHNVVDFVFNPPEMVEIPAGKVYNMTSTLKFFKKRQYGCFRVYTTLYPFNSQLDYSKYHSKDDFIKYEDDNSYLITNRIYIGK